MTTASAARSLDFEDRTYFRSGASPVGTQRGDILQLPRFPSYSYASETAASRIAARINASAIAPAEHKALLGERQALLDKEFDGTISPKEKNRLKYVRWTLDRIDDARYGAGLERLEAMVEHYERFSADIEAFQAEL